MGLDRNNTGTSKTYIPVNKTNDQVISDHATFLRNKFKLVVDEENKKLPDFTGSLNFINTPKKPDL